LTILFIRFDNAGEKKTAQEELPKLAPQVQFAFTAPDTPQQNGCVERKFATLYGCVHATMNQAQFPNKVRHKLWAEAANMANKAENMSLKVGKTVPPFKELFGLKPKNIWNLRRFGEVGIAKKGPDIQSKIANPGIAVMYLGHAKDHGQEVYRLFNLDTRRVVLSWDVRWLDQNYTNYKKSQGLCDPSDEDGPDDVSDEEQDDGVDEVNNNEEQQTATNAMTTNSNNHVSWADVTQRTTRSAIKAGATLDNLGQTSKPNAKLVRQMARLSGTGIYTNPVAEKVLDEAQQQEQALDKQLPPEDEDTGQQDTENAQLGRDYASFMMDKTLDPLFGDFTFFVRKTMMEPSNDQDIELENTPMMDKNETKLMTEVNNLKKHIIDLLDETIRNDNKRLSRIVLSR
jgi:hypothetical protein